MERLISEVKHLPKMKKLLRVAAYARVSRDKQEALNSLSAQVSHYNSLICSNRNWLFAGIYSDYALSGTKDNRPEFNKMLDEARNGRIDMIITKSISRFSRNFLTTLQIIRELKAIDVDIYFEEEHMHTSDPKTEMILSIMSMFAEAQAKEVSENMLWRIKKDFLDGKLWGGCDCLGYKIVDRRYVLVPEEAELVKRIYNLYLSGLGDLTIAKLLNKEGIPTRKSVDGWNKVSINYILTNPTYTGDLVLQKTYRKNYLSKTKCYNRGQRNLYIVENSHEAIIDKETFQRVQELRRAKSDKCMPNIRTKVHHYFDDLLYCEICGKKYRFRKGQYRDSYVCRTFAEKGKDVCPSKAIPDRVLVEVVKNTLKMDEFDESFLRKKIDRILVNNGNILTFCYKDGTREEVHWEDPSRKDGWNETNRATARERALKRTMKRGKNGKWQKLQ